MHGTAVNLHVITVAPKGLPGVSVECMHNFSRGINVHDLMACLLNHVQLGARYSAVFGYGDIAAVVPT